MFRSMPFFVADNTLRRLLAYCVMILFVFTADAIMSYYTPTFIQGAVSSSLLMGMVMSFSSIVGLVMDLIFPQLLRGLGVKTITGMLLVAALGFASVMLIATWLPWLGLVLLAVGIWGTYYELINFSGQQFVSVTVEPHRRSTAWGILSVFKSLAYVLGPIIAGLALSQGNRTPLVLALSLGLVAMVIFMFMRFRDHQVQLPHHEINFWAEFGHWRVLALHLWPILLLSITMGLVDSTFWTTGAVWSQKLSQTNGLGGLFLSAYMFPSLFVGLIVAKLGIFEGKKKLAELFLLLSNLTLIGIGLSREIWWQLLVVLVSSILSSFAYPLINAVYSDILARMGRERKHLIGLSGSTFSLAYIFGPILAGLVAGLVGEQRTFVVVGTGAALVTLILLFVTPRKLKLPSAAIASWQD